MTTELAWAAGLFEGEGSFSRSAKGRVRASLKMVEESSVRRFHDAVGVGKVYGPYGPYKKQTDKDGYERRPYFMWIASEEDAAAVLLRLGPLLTGWRKPSAISHGNG